MIGFDYKQSPVEVREKVSFTAKSIEKAYEEFNKNRKINESIIVSTCNRSEIYTILNDPEENIIYLKRFYANFFKLDESIIKDYLVIRTGENMIKHIFEVTCGFQSQILGEDQILGQIKEAYKNAVKLQSSGKFLNRLFLNSITTSKKIKTSTGISKNAISVSSIGVKLIEQKLGNLENKKALIVGLGDMSKISVKNLLNNNIGKVFITNRTSKKVTDFAKEFPGIVQIDFKNRYDVINDVDIIISCTSAPHFVINKDKFEEYYNNKPLCMLDLALPRDIDPNIQEISPNIKLYRLDDLNEIANDNIEKRLKAKEQSVFMLKQDIKNYIKWMEETKAAGVIKTMQSYSQDIIDKEVCKLKEILVDISEDKQYLIEKSFRTLAKTLLHKQTIKIKEIMTEKSDIYNDIQSKEGSAT